MNFISLIKTQSARLSMIFGWSVVRQNQLRLEDGNASEIYHVDEVVIFGGIYEKNYVDLEKPPSDIRFDFFVEINEAFVPLPGISSDAKVMAHLMRMARGQKFKILEQESWGPMGTRVNKIKILKGSTLSISNQVTESCLIP